MKILRFFFISILTSFLFFFSFETKIYAYDNITVVIDPGHGGNGIEDESELGAIYSDDLLEKDVDLTTAKALYEELSQYPNITCYMTREEDKKLSLQERIDFALSVNADLVVSVHYNASESHIFYGSEIFTSAFGGCYVTGYGVATSIMNKWTGYGLPDKGIKTRLNNEGNDYYGLIRIGKDSNLPVIILEHGYLDNSIDREVLKDEEAYRMMGRMDAEGIADYYGVSKNIMSGRVTPTIDVKLPEDIVYPDTTAPSNAAVDIGLFGTVIDDRRVEYNYTITCDEPESKLMYYNAAIGNIDTVATGDFADLKLWGKRDAVSDTIILPRGFSGNIVFRVYNNYGLYTDIETHLTDDETSRMKEAAENSDKAEEEVSEAVEDEETVSDDMMVKKESVSENRTVSEAKIPSAENMTVNKGSEKQSESMLEKMTTDTSLIYGLIFVLATIVFILLIIIIALVKQGIGNNRDDDGLDF